MKILILTAFIVVSSKCYAQQVSRDTLYYIFPQQVQLSIDSIIKSKKYDVTNMYIEFDTKCDTLIAMVYPRSQTVEKYINSNIKRAVILSSQVPIVFRSDFTLGSFDKEDRYWNHAIQGKINTGRTRTMILHHNVVGVKFNTERLLGIVDQY